MKRESPQSKQTKAALAEDSQSVPGPEQRLHSLYAGMIRD